MSWRATKIFYLGVVVFSLGIAFGFVALGFWPILPFAGAELLGLGAGFYWYAKASEQRELVYVDGSRVAIEKGKRLAEQSWEFQRPWTRVRLSRSRVAWYPTKLMIGSHGKEIEVGQFLNEQERRQLADELRHAINGLN